MDQLTQPRAFVYGAGRGGQLAHMLTLFYPELLRATASVGAEPCTLPVESMLGAGGVTLLNFPAGLGNVARYRDQPLDMAALARVDFWIQAQSPRAERQVQGCDWLDEPPAPGDRLLQYSTLLTQFGADVEVVPAGDGADQPWRRAMSFFEALPPD